MEKAKHLLKASLDAGRDLLCPAELRTASTDVVADQAAATTGPEQRPHGAHVPIRSISADEREAIARHLLALDADDRYLRFGYAASDEQIRNYVNQLDFRRDEIFGITNRKLELIAMAHLAFGVDPQCSSRAEFGVSVQAHARGRGYGTQLFERAVTHARNQGVGTLFIHALSQNTVMLGIARKAGAVVERDGSESEAWLSLPAATLDSRVTELVEHRIAEADFTVKSGAKRVHDLIDGLQDVRRVVRDVRQTIGR